MVKSDLNAIEFLESVKSTQQNWVLPGTGDTSVSPGLTHNVSNTVIVGKDDWDTVAEYLWTNREFFTGVSLLSETGDKDFAFAPMEAIRTEADEARWNQILAQYVPVDYSTLVETTDETDLKGEVACAGGFCEVQAV
jgi:ribonucleoside-triphosphate reductase